MKGVIVAAGYGTRFLPATKTVPKELFPLVDKPALAFLVDEYLAAGIDELLVITSRRKKALDDWFDREVELEGVFTREGKAARLAQIAPPAARVSFARQHTMRGTGDALLLAESFAAGEPLLVAYPDDLVFGPDPLAAQLARAATAPDECLLAVMQVPMEETERYGVVRLAAGSADRVAEVVEKPARGTAPSNLAVIGRFVLAPEIFPLLRAERDKHPDGEFFHIGPLNTLAAAGKVRAVPFTGLRLDIGEPLGYLAASVEYALSRPELAEPFRTWMRERLAGS